MRVRNGLVEALADQCPRIAGTLDWLVCPTCGARLGKRNEAFDCVQCRTVWPVINGTPHFIEEFPYWGEIPFEAMQRVNRDAAEQSWKTALADSAEPTVQEAAGMILNLDRANWQWLIDLPAESRVLDLGAGMGTNSHALAMRFREVVALEPVLERVRFMEQRFRQEGLSNVAVLRSSLWKLPFAAGTFDLAVMNGVLEWVAAGQPGDPRRVQERALRKICRLLRPGGHLYVGIENRVGLGYCVGYPDPHCGLPFVTVLPRPLAQWYARRRGQDGYRNFLYSSRGYRRLLRNAGFSRVDIYLALPSYNHPRYLIPLKENVFSFYARNYNAVPGSPLKRFVYKLLLSSGLLKYCEYSFAILARK